MSIVYLVLKMTGAIVAACCFGGLGYWVWGKARGNFLCIMALLCYVIAIGCVIAMPVIFWTTIAHSIFN